MGIYLSPPFPENNLYVSKESSFPIPSKYTNIVRHTKTSLDILEESRVDDLWNIDGNKIISDSWIQEIPHPQLASYLWVDGRLT